MRAALLLPLLLGGCSLALEFPDDCEQSPDCPVGYRCNAEKLCVARSAQVDAAVGRDATVPPDAMRPDAATLDSGEPPGDAATPVDGAPPDAAPPVFVTDERCPSVRGVAADELRDPDVVVFGVLLPFSGQLGPFGPPIAQAIYLAVDEINDTGGLAGRRLGVVTCDTGTDPVIAVDAARRLVDEVGVPAIIGPAASSLTLEVFNQVARPAGVVVFTPSGTSPSLTNAEEGDLLWRTVPSDAIQGAAIAAHVLHEGYDRVAVINRDDTYGDGLRQAIQAGLCAADRCGEDAYLPRSYPESGDLQVQASLLPQIRQFSPDVVVLIAFVDDGISFMNLAAGAGFENFILTDGTKDIEIAAQVTSDPLLEGAVGTAPASPAGSNYQSFSLEYRARWETEPGVFNANAYDALYLLAYAAGAAGDERPSGAELARHLRRLSSGATINAGRADWGRGLQILRASAQSTFDFEGASGPLDFDSAGEAPSDIEGWYVDLPANRIRSHGVIYTAGGQYRPIPDAPGPPDAGMGAPDGGQ